VGGNIHDVAHLTGGVGTLGGTITFQVFAPGDTTFSTPTSVPPSKTVAGAGDTRRGFVVRPRRARLGRRFSCVPDDAF
jgi:hypothetical protein